MPHVLKMKDGKLLTPFSIRDLLGAVEDYAGEELRREIEEYIDANVEDIDDYEKEYDRMEQDNERLADHQRSVLCNIRDGLNIQQGGHILIWFGLTWSLELYQQTNARLWRQGQTHVVTIHHIITKNTVDEDVVTALEQKDMTQEKLISAVKAQLGV